MPAGKPAGVAAAPDGRHVYVSSPEGAFVTVLATEPPAVVRRIAWRCSQAVTGTEIR